MMKKIRVILSIVLMCTVFSGCKAEPKDDIYIVFTSDVHCSVNENFTMSALKAYVDDLKAEHEYVTLVDTGDFVQGGTMGTMSKGEMIIDIMNAADYDIVTYGNHEFDYGMDRTAELMKELKAEKIASNVRYSGSGTNIFEDVPEYVIKDYGGVKVAFLGILTPTTITTSTPKYFMEDGEFVYDFYGQNYGQDLYDRIQGLVDELRDRKKVDYVIALSHLGSDAELDPYDSISFISHTSGIDAVLDGHSHSLIVEDIYPNRNGEDVILSSVGTKMQEIGELIIGKDGSLTVLHMEQYDRSDETVAAEIEKIEGELGVLLSEEVTETDFDLRIADDEGIRMVRTRETNLADLAADAFRYAMETDISLFNGGGIRAGINAGTVTYNDLLSVMPFQNTAASCCATGQQILDALEFSYRSCQGLYAFDGNATGENGGFLQVSGLKLTIDTTVESPVMVDDDGMFAGIDETRERRVKDVHVLQDGEYVPIDPEKTYTVASVTYVLIEGGDGNTAFSGCDPIVEADPVDVEVLKEYIAYLGEDIERYREADDRITVK